jgi:hypothetical protein
MTCDSRDLDRFIHYGTCHRIHISVLFLVMVHIAFGVSDSQAHPYLPLESGSTTILHYHFQIKNTKMVQKPDDIHGEIVMHYDRFEEKHGKRYLRQTTSYRNIPYITTEQQVWRREENGNIYLSSMLHGQWIETLELPKDVEIGREWAYYDGEKSKRKVSKRFDLKLDDGNVIADCLEITRTIVTNEQLKNVVNKSYYCRDIGDAGSLFLQPSPIGDYTTETRLKSYRRSMD